MEKRTVLIADDNVDHVELMRRSLDACHRDVHCQHVADGPAVMDYVLGRGLYRQRHRHPFPDLLLLDLHLPGLNGLEVLKRIKTRPDLRVLPVLLLTSSSAEEDMEKAYRRHANGYLIKPSDYEEFSRLVRDVCRYWLQRNRQPTQLRE